ncbi:cyclin-like protein [Annulohypoxylon moriforme]|nr:cyclin-like protein [Annulohypoxylon moriforme]
MAPSHGFKNGSMEPRGLTAGPDLGTIKVGHQYICECRIGRMFAERRLDPAREANYRLQGIQVIQSTREALLLPVKTYNTACTLYHRFRLDHPTPDYNYTDAALASLFVACKIEDTLKKSREILCAHHNLKNPDHPTTQDDKIFDQPSKVLIGIERFMVEAINFDFRVRYPQKIIAKIIKKVLAPPADISDFIPTALKMSVDLYMTYAPLKHSSYTCALVIVQLTALITNQFHEEFGSMNPLDWHTDEQCVAEVMLDLLDLYTQHGKATKVGPEFDLQVFIDVQIRVNQYSEGAGLSRYVNQCRECQSTIPPPTPSSDSPMSLNTPSASGTSTIKRGLKGTDGGTTRFIFDSDEAVREKTIYNEYNMDEFEEWEEEFEEPIPDPRDDRRHEPRGPRGPRGHGRGHGRGGFDPGWTPRNRHDRRRRGGGFY